MRETGSPSEVVYAAHEVALEEGGGGPGHGAVHPSPCGNWVPVSTTCRVPSERITASARFPRGRLLCGPHRVEGVPRRPVGDFIPGERVTTAQSYHGVCLADGLRTIWARWEPTSSGFLGWFHFPTRLEPHMRGKIRSQSLTTLANVPQVCARRCQAPGLGVDGPASLRVFPLERPVGHSCQDTVGPKCTTETRRALRSTCALFSSHTGVGAEDACAASSTWGREAKGRSHNHHGWGGGQRCPWWHLASAADSSGHRKGWRDATGPLRCTEWVHTPKHEPALADSAVGGLEENSGVEHREPQSKSEPSSFLNALFGDEGLPIRAILSAAAGDTAPRIQTFCGKRTALVCSGEGRGLLLSTLQGTGAPHQQRMTSKPQQCRRGGTPRLHCSK